MTTKPFFSTIHLFNQQCSSGKEFDMKRIFTAIDLFSGAGGMSQGFQDAGFQILAANDFDTFASETFAQNHKHANFLNGPIQDISTRKFLAASGLKKGQLDTLLGGPPCQAFSVYNHQRGMHDERSGLFREYLRLVKGLMPKTVVMENVTGITSVASGRAVKEIYASLQQLGYYVEHQILKAEQFGIPQERRRIFFLASRDCKFVNWPIASHGPSTEAKYVTVSDAIGDLPALRLTEGEEACAYTTSAETSYQRKLRKRCKLLCNHVAPNLSEINQKRLLHIPQGGSWRDIPFQLLPAGMKRAKRSDHTKRYGRLDPKGLASTILTKCDLHWGAFIHYDLKQQRTLTVREAARLQSFPDCFRFTGSRGEQFRQVGNAVPPILAETIARSVIKMIQVEQVNPDNQLEIEFAR